MRNIHNRPILLVPILLLCTILMLVSPARAQQWEFPLPTVTARGAVLIDAGSGQILYGKAEHERFFPASTTKIMTALLALTHSAPDDVTTVTTTAVAVDGSLAYLQPGERISLQDLLHGLMLVSGNDAAVAIAEHVSGSTEAFADLMNEQAATLGMSGTHFVNPHGLHDPDHYTTPLDLAILARIALADDAFARLVATDEYTTDAEPRRDYVNGNRLLWTLPGATGVKTGFTPEANSTLVASAERDGRHLIAVVMDTGTEEKWNDATTLLEYGFAAFVPYSALSTSQPATHVTVNGGATPAVPVKPAQPVTVLVGREGTEPGPYVLQPADVSVTPDVASELSAPVAAGAAVGSASVAAGAQVLGQTELVTAADVPIAEINPAAARDGAWQAIAAWPVWELIRLWWYVPVLLFGAWRLLRSARRRRHVRRRQLRDQTGVLPMHRLFRGQ